MAGVLGRSDNSPRLPTYCSPPMRQLKLPVHANQVGVSLNLTLNLNPDCLLQGLVKHKSRLEKDKEMAAQLAREAVVPQGSQLRKAATSSTFEGQVCNAALLHACARCRKGAILCLPC